MTARGKTLFALAVLLFGTTLYISKAALAAKSPAEAKEAALKASEIGKNLFPEQVFFHGQVASSQMRNAGGVRFADGFFVLAALVDNSGYSSDIRQKYQTYLITEVDVEVGGQTLKPGAYGVGFLDGGNFVVMDLGAHDLFTTAWVRDAEIRRPVPLQVIAGSGGSYRLYAGREYVEIKRK